MVGYMPIKPGAMVCGAVPPPFFAVDAVAAAAESFETRFGSTVLMVSSVVDTGETPVLASGVRMVEKEGMGDGPGDGRVGS
jgi:hypothetical protein